MSRTKIARPHISLGLLLSLPFLAACSDGEEVAQIEGQLDSFAGLPSDYSYPDELHMGAASEPYASPYRSSS